MRNAVKVGNPDFTNEELSSGKVGPGCPLRTD